MKSKGERIFARCQSKNIKSISYAKDPDSDTSYAPVADLKQQGKRIENITYLANLNCPTTEQTGDTIRSSTAHLEQSGAIKDLAKVAGIMACQTCEFAGLSRTEANEKLLELEKIELEREQLRADRLELARTNIETVQELHADFPDVIPNPTDRNIFRFLD